MNRVVYISLFCVFLCSFVHTLVWAGDGSLYGDEAEKLGRLRCEIALGSFGDSQTSWRQTHVAQVKDLIAAEDVDGYVVRMKAPFVERDLPILVPNKESLDNEGFKKVLENTVGIIWRDTTGLGEIEGHSYVRIGDRIYDLQMAGKFASDFGRMMKKRFDYNFGVRDRDGRTPYYETLFPITPEVKAELQRYFEDRTREAATIDGNPITSHWVWNAKSHWDRDGKLCENCTTFGTSFAYPRWWGDYPLLREATRQTGLTEHTSAAIANMHFLFDPKANAIGFVSWGRNETPGATKTEHDILVITQWEHQIVPVGPE